MRHDRGEAGGLIFGAATVGFGLLQMLGVTTFIFSLQAFSSPPWPRPPAQITERGTVPIGVRSDVSNLLEASALNTVECMGLVSKGAILLVVRALPGRAELYQFLDTFL